jgi:hypothetical protein
MAEYDGLPLPPSFKHQTDTRTATEQLLSDQIVRNLA